MTAALAEKRIASSHSLGSRVARPCLSSPLDLQDQDGWAALHSVSAGQSIFDEDEEGGEKEEGEEGPRPGTLDCRSARLGAGEGGAEGGGAPRRAARANDRRTGPKSSQKTERQGRVGCAGSGSDLRAGPRPPRPGPLARPQGPRALSGLGARASAEPNGLRAALHWPLTVILL